MSRRFQFRRKVRIDANQEEIMERLRDVGASVVSLHNVGAGVPDLLVGYRGRNYLLEVKSEIGSLTEPQVIFGQSWRGSFAIVRSIDSALAVIGAK